MATRDAHPKRTVPISPEFLIYPRFVFSLFVCFDSFCLRGFFGRVRIYLFGDSANLRSLFRARSEIECVALWTLQYWRTFFADGPFFRLWPWKYIVFKDRNVKSILNGDLYRFFGYFARSDISFEREFIWECFVWCYWLNLHIKIAFFLVRSSICVVQSRVLTPH